MSTKQNPEIKQIGWQTFEFREHGLLQGDRNTGYDVVVRTALQGRKDSPVDPRLEVLERLPVGLLADPASEENEPGTRPSQAFVRRRRHDVGVAERTRNCSTRNLLRIIGIN